MVFFSGYLENGGNLLVGGFNNLEKYEVNGKDYPIYYGK
jgi:hypothetical protein